MNPLRRTLVWAGCTLLAFLAVEGNAQAAGIGFRNELKFPVVVQGSSVVNGQVRRGFPIGIAPGKIAWDNKLPPGTRFISVYDGTMPNNPPILRDVPVPFQGMDLFFSIRVVPGGKILLVAEPIPPP